MYHILLAFLPFKTHQNILILACKLRVASQLYHHHEMRFWRFVTLFFYFIFVKILDKYAHSFKNDAECLHG